MRTRAETPATALGSRLLARMRDDPAHLVFDGLHFECTSRACPEQYDVFRVADARRPGTSAGYVRLRHGRLTAEVPHHAEDGYSFPTRTTLVYHRADEALGDGMFADDETRTRALRACASAIDDWYRLCTVTDTATRALQSAWSESQQPAKRQSPAQ